MVLDPQPPSSAVLVHVQTLAKLADNLFVHPQLQGNRLLNRNRNLGGIFLLKQAFILKIDSNAWDYVNDMVQYWLS